MKGVLCLGKGRADMLTTYISSYILIYMDYTHEQHTVHLIVYHIIWCPKRRRRVLIGKVAERLEQLICEVATENTWEVLTLAIQPDHVHVFLRANPYTLPTDIARLIKGRSSHLLRVAFFLRKPVRTLFDPVFQVPSKIKPCVMLNPSSSVHLSLAALPSTKGPAANGTMR